MKKFMDIMSMFIFLSTLFFLSWFFVFHLPSAAEEQRAKKIFSQITSIEFPNEGEFIYENSEFTTQCDDAFGGGGMFCSGYFHINPISYEKVRKKIASNTSITNDDNNHEKWRVILFDETKSIYFEYSD